MGDMIFGFFLNNWALAAFILAAVVAFVRFGWAGVAAVIAVAAGWFGFSFGRDGERAKQASKERQDVKTVNDIRADVQGASPDEKKKRLDPWTRKE